MSNTPTLVTFKILKIFNCSYNHFIKYCDSQIICFNEIVIKIKVLMFNKIIAYTHIEYITI